MQTHFIAFRKLTGRVRIEIAVEAGTRQEARTIAESEMAKLDGYRFAGSN